MVARRQEMSAMSDPAVLLITADPSLVEMVQGVIASVANLRLLTVEAVRDACPRLGEPDVALVLPHLTRDSDAAEVAVLLETVAALGQPVATVVISDHSQAEKAVALLRQGAADYLKRPLDRDRLAWLIDRLTVRARYGASQARPAQEAAPPAPVDLDPLLCAAAAMTGV